MSQALKIGIGEAIGLGRPLVEARERIIGRAAIRFGQNHMVAVDPVGDLVTFANPQKTFLFCSVTGTKLSGITAANSEKQRR